MIKLSTIKKNPNNPRVLRDAQFEKLKKSIAEFPQMMELRPIVVDKDNIVLGGNMRLEALKALGKKEIPESWVKRADELTEEQKREFVIKDNVGFGDWDWDSLANEWDAVELADWGLEIPEIVAIDAEEESKDAEPQIDKAVELNKKWQVKPGDLWRIGEHRLLCGDSTKREDVQRVMGVEKAQLCFTSPPYAEQRKEQYGGIPESEYCQWFSKIQGGVRAIIQEHGHFVVNIKPHVEQKQRSLYVFDLVTGMVREHGWFLVDEFCWLRTGIPQQVVHRFKNAFEPCYWFAASDGFKWYPEEVMHESDSVPLALGKGAGNTSAARRQGKGGGAIQGNEIVSGWAYPSNVLDFKNNADALGHPAAFPVHLPKFFVECMTKAGDVSFDPFLGSGTTMVACENLGRKCRGIEISPDYCAVILERMLTAFPELEIKRIDG